MVRTSLKTPLRKSKRKKVIKPKVAQKELSELPSELLHQILSKLSTKDSVRTSVLSRCWKYLWLDVPALDLNFHDFEDKLDLGKFMDYFLKHNRYIEKFNLIYDLDPEHFHDDFVRRLHKVVKRRVTHFNVENRVEVDDALVRMPLSLYSCATLVDLSLYCVVFDDPKSELVSLHCLKSLCLEGVKFDGESLLETIVSSCSVLEYLTVITHPDDYLEVLCIRSRSLRYFRLGSEREEDEDASVEIDAPRLEYLCITDYQPESFIIQNIASFAKLDLDVAFDVDHDDPSDITKMRNFLSSISTFKDITISAQTLEAFLDYSEVGTLPQFSNLSRLDASLVDSFWEALQVFLSCCMNLDSLTLEIDRLPDKEELKQYPLPQCVRSSLECLKLNPPLTLSKKKLATYFRKNCPTLNKILIT